MTTHDTTTRQRPRPGPRRPPGSPVGPDAVRRALLDAGAELFARHGVAAVSLRDIAAAADVQLGLIARYVGTRDDLIRAVFDDLGRQVAARLAADRTAMQSFDPESELGRWSRLLIGLVLSDGHGPDLGVFNPVTQLAEVAVEEYGADPAWVNVRAAQVVALAVGWRLLEDYLVEASDGFGGRDLGEVHTDLNALVRWIGATPFPLEPPPSAPR